MREIKFRVWDKREGKMIYNVENAYNGHWQMNDVQYFGQLISNPNYDLMQYTGLKDKNSKEIYEGDLVEPEMETDGNWDKYEACEVVFDETYGTYCFKNDAPNLLTDYRNLEIVGNAYENPELLK